MFKTKTTKASEAGELIYPWVIVPGSALESVDRVPSVKEVKLVKPAGIP